MVLHKKEKRVRWRRIFYTWGKLCGCGIRGFSSLRGERRHCIPDQSPPRIPRAILKTGDEFRPTCWEEYLFGHMFSGNLVPCGHWKNSCTGWVPLSSPICRGKKLRQTYSPPPPPPLYAHDDRGRRGRGGGNFHRKKFSFNNDFISKRLLHEGRRDIV